MLRWSAATRNDAFAVRRGRLSAKRAKVGDGLGHLAAMMDVLGFMQIDEVFRNVR